MKRLEILGRVKRDSFHALISVLCEESKEEMYVGNKGFLLIEEHGLGSGIGCQK